MLTFKKNSTLGSKYQDATKQVLMGALVTCVKKMTYDEKRILDQIRSFTEDWPALSDHCFGFGSMICWINFHHCHQFCFQHQWATETKNQQVTLLHQSHSTGDVNAEIYYCIRCNSAYFAWVKMQ